jgi:hypothetical protein
MSSLTPEVYGLSITAKKNEFEPMSCCVGYLFFSLESQRLTPCKHGPNYQAWGFLFIAIAPPRMAESNSKY